MLLLALNVITRTAKAIALKAMEEGRFALLFHRF